jgi:multiple sugar transport system substrate-binding protein
MVLFTLPFMSFAARKKEAAPAGEGPLSPEDAWFRKAAKPFKNVTLKIIGEALPPLDALAKKSAEFTAITGIKVDVEGRDMDSLNQKLTADFVGGTGLYDVGMVWWGWVPAYVENDWLVPNSEMMKNKDITYSGFDLKKSIANQNWLNMLASYKNEIYGVPFSVHILLHYWRWDLFENPEEMKNFKKMYGYDLPSPPINFQQLKDTSYFFTRKAGQMMAGKALDHDVYGITLCGKRHSSTVYNWCNYLYASGGHYVDSPTQYDYGPVIVNSKVAVKALEYYKDLVDNACPPGTVTYTWDEQLAAIQTGLAVQTTLWADAAYATSVDESQSKVVGKIAYTGQPIGTRKIVNMNGWVLAVAKSSKNPEPAWLFLQWSQKPEVQALLMSNGTIALPDSAYTVPSVYNLDYAPTHYYLTGGKALEIDGKKAIRTRGKAWGLPNEFYTAKDPTTGSTVPEIIAPKTFPESAIIEEVLAKYLNDCFSGGLSPQKALDGAAEELKQKIPKLK